MKVERDDQLAEYAEPDIDQDPPVTVLRNGGFELGTMDYWMSMTGTAFEYDPIDSSTSTYWETRSYRAEGNYFLNGFLNAETAVGTMRSEKFSVVLDDDGYSYASFKLGAAKDGEKCYVAVVDASTGTELVKVTNTAFVDPGLAETLVTYYVDLSSYTDRTLYFKLVDEDSDGDFGALVAETSRLILLKKKP